MKRVHDRLMAFLLNRDISFDYRLSMMFVIIGCVSCAFATGVFILGHVSVIAVLLSLLCVLLTPVTYLISRHFGKLRSASKIIAFAMAFFVPMIWVFAGGFYSGMSVWFIYDLYFISIAAPKDHRARYLLPTILMQLLCVFLEVTCPAFLARYSGTVLTPVVTVGSLVIVALAILSTVIIQKDMYLHEKQYGDEKRDTSLQFITSIAAIIDAKDSYTGGHSKRVAQCASSIACAMGMDEAAQKNLHLVGMMHDIGKIGVPDTVLNTPGQLTADQFDMVRRHPVIGGEILKDMDFIPNIREGAMYHHERWDGKGYPFRLAGEAIPLCARIICVADAYDAMSTNRVYRKRMTTEQIIAEFRRCSGSQFDPMIVNVFVGMLDNGFGVSGTVVDASPEEKSVSSVVAQMLDQALRSRNTEDPRVVDDLHINGDYQGSMTLDYNNFSRMHEYILRIGARLGCRFVLLVTTLHMPSGIPPSQLEAARDRSMDLLGQAISHSIRTVDVCTRYSPDCYLIILLNTDEAGTEQIMHRVRTGFLNITGDSSVGITYEVLHD